jgi:hypothetical protein
MGVTASVPILPGAAVNQERSYASPKQVPRGMVKEMKAYQTSIEIWSIMSDLVLYITLLSNSRTVGHIFFCQRRNRSLSRGLLSLVIRKRSKKKQAANHTVKMMLTT